MTPKEYLTQTYRIEQRIESLRRELKRIKEDIPIASYENIGGHSSLISSPTEIKADKCIELTELIQGEMDKLILTVMNIHRAISDLPDVDEQLVLRMRYLERGEDGKFQKWESISYRLKTDKRQVLRIHGKALEHLQICH